MGELMLHTDFINFQGDNALAHLKTDSAAERFVDPKPAYEPEASALLGRRLADAGARVHEGVYVGVRGPIYETRAELAMLRSFGADAIGMSTVPEVALCQFLRLPAVGVSVITNECFGTAPVSHDEVVSGSQAAIPLLAKGVRAFLDQPTDN
jgi:purine-nucleoside phosphorylase